MSSGGRMQLAAIGEQDYYLTSNPQLSFFKKAYKRHTNFAIEPMLIPLDENTGADGNRFNKEVRTIIPRKGNLLHKLYLFIDVELTSTSTNNGITVSNFANTLIKNAQIRIGGMTIEEYTSQFKQLKSELLNESRLKQNVTDVNGGKSVDFSGVVDDTIYIDNTEKMKGNIPLFNKYMSSSNHKLLYEFDFWFTRNMASSIPLDSLSNHDIELIFQTETKNNMIGNMDNLKITNMLLYGDYIIVDGEEKRRFAQSSHEYLIEQTSIQTETTNGTNSGSNKLLNQSNYKLAFNNPVKYLLWGITNPGTPYGNPAQGPTYFVSQTTSSLSGDDGTKGTLYFQLNGQNITPENYPIVNYTRFNQYKYLGHCAPLDIVGFYSFATKPFDIEPSGTCNFSRLTRVDMIASFANNSSDNIIDKDLFIFAVNYNIFRISSGMGGLLYA